MRLTVNTSELNATVATVAKALGVKAQIGIFEGIYAEAIGDTLLLRCTDLALQIDATMKVSIDRQGACVFPGRLFSELVRRLPGEETLLSVESNTLHIESGRATSTMQVENAKDYVAMPEIIRQFSLTISKRTLKDMVRQCIFAAAQDDAKPILRGVLFEIEDGRLSMVALDGYRLAMRTEAVTVSGAPRSVVLQSRGLLEISRILDDSDEPVSLVFSQTHVMIDMGHTRIMTRLMDGDYIRYKQILPSEHTTHVRVNRAELLDSIDRVSLMARESKRNHVKFSFEDGQVTITANSEIGASKEVVYIDRVGNDIEIAFNSKYFTDVLKVLDDEYVCLDMNNSVSPCVVRPENGNSFYYLILPVRLFAGA